MRPVVVVVIDAENDAVADATESAAQPSSSTSDAVATATGCQHHPLQQQFDERLTGDTCARTCIHYIG